MYIGILLSSFIYHCAQFLILYFVSFLQGFVTSVGSRDRRCRLALQSALPPVIHSTCASILTVIMLYTSPFEFIVRHFFWLLLAVMLIGVINGLFFFPIILSLVGPAAELVPLEHTDRISTPSPPLHRHRRSSSSSSSNNKTVVLNNRSSGSGRNSSKHQAKNINLNNEPSLTTITEEPQSWKSSTSSISTGPPINEYYHRNNCSGVGGGVNNGANGGGTGGHHNNHPHHHHHHHPNNVHSGCHLGGAHTELKSIVVQPEVTVETTHNGNDQNTKVTATANIKVELVTPGRPTTCQQYNS